MKYLGEQFDIHTGGIDLTFPHHEDEIAQSAGVTGEQPVRYWVHGEFLVIGNRKMKVGHEAAEDEGEEDQSIKMSRSKGNVILVSTLKELNIDPMAYRYLLLTAHYRSKLNFTDESITAAQNGLKNLRDDLAALPAVDLTTTHEWSVEAQRMHEEFQRAINDDLELPTALSITREAARTSKLTPEERRRLVLDFDRVLGLRLETVEAKAPRIISDAARELIQQRDAARAARDWKRSDLLREQLKALGFEVRDTAKGTELV